MQRDAELADHKRQLQQLELRLASIEGRMQCHKPVKIILVRWASRAAFISPALSALALSRHPTVPACCSHAESEGNADKMAYQTIGDPNVRLTPQGRCQVGYRWSSRLGLAAQLPPRAADRQVELASAELTRLVGEQPIWAYVSPCVSIQRAVRHRHITT